MEIKALSIKEPWASMIARGEKTIETRTKKTNHRGPLLICATKKPAIENAGHAVALVWLVDCRPMTKDDEEAACCPYEEGRYAWVLENVTPIRPYPVKGKQGIFTVDLPSKKG